MSPHLEAKLKASWPSLFQDMPDDHIIIRCGDGWYDIIDVMCQSISQLAGSIESSSTNVFDITQEDADKFCNGYTKLYLDYPRLVTLSLTEQFGVLATAHRFEYSRTAVQLSKLMDGGKARYPEITRAMMYDPYIANVDGIMWYAENLSAKTCEFSGLPGILHRSESGWYRTLNTEVAKTTYVNQGFAPVKDE